MYDWDEAPDLNITPLVDVMLVLMSILMISAPTIHYEEKISLPDGSQSNQLSKIKELNIKIDAKGMVYINKTKFSTLNEFADEFVLKSVDYKKDSFISIYADKDILYGEVMKLLGEIKKQGFLKVSLITQ
ncbi:Biopolymer transport protein ExbD/TolR [hydrothermal vent metagenome]|uniref:Biopolymer transport protein ExbD/TolR n=1 Tax=hydrothermal vent metagenome TaxID=652676 RepID=A0A1W1EHU1_9ZZZZ